MTYRQRFINTVLFEEIDRHPLSFFFPPWDETLARWHREGLDPAVDWRDALGLEPGFEVIDVNLTYYPKFEKIVLEDRGNTRIIRDEFGVVLEEYKEHWTLPRFIKAPVSSREDWEKIKAERLDPSSPGRLPSNWNEIVARFKELDAVSQVGYYPSGLFGFARELMGVEELLLAFYDNPGLIADIMDYMTDFWIAIYGRVLKDIRIDHIHIWEDMSGKQGPLISPAMMRQFMAPNYKKIKAFADAHGVKILSVDTDGDVSEIVPIFAECGFNLIFPFEVAAGCDIVQYRKKYPRLGIMGGIDKREIARGREAIDRELQRIAPMFETGGYIPSLDHLVHPEISWQDMQYFVRRLREIIAEKHGGACGIRGA